MYSAEIHGAIEPAFRTLHRRRLLRSLSDVFTILELLGVILGLVLGKAVGIFSGTYARPQ